MDVASRSQLSGIRLVPDRLREMKSWHRHNIIKKVNKVEKAKIRDSPRQMGPDRKRYISR